ncbi:MAG: hypothetical protein PHH23_01720 [Paludibacteraceae bacterium]|nr:hypothetical protein [Paludibacteraceae bacterium]
MGIKAHFDQASFDAACMDAVDSVNNRIVNSLAYLGEMCVKEARDRSMEESWIDRTGNLRSSVGYLITYNGNVVSASSFQSVKGGSEGSATGRKLADELACKHSDGFALVVVAGMSYAVLVEAMENKCVLASAELLAKKELPIMMQMLQQQLNAI